MTLFTEHSYSRVMVFIDYRNVQNAAKHMVDCRLDLYRLTQVLVGNRDLVGAYIFDALYTEGDARNEPAMKEHSKLRDNGFRVIVKRDAIKVRDDGKEVQKEVDVSMACEMVEHALLNHYDVAIVVSGDMDFVPAMMKVQAAGKRVEVAAFDDFYNDKCKSVADVYYLLDDIPFMSMATEVSEVGYDDRFQRFQETDDNRWHDQ